MRSSPAVARCTIVQALATATALFSANARAQCVVEGIVGVDALARVGDRPTRAIEQQMRVTFSGRSARLRGISPIAFDTSVASGDVRLYLREGSVFDELVGAAANVEIHVERVEGTVVIATLRSNDNLSVRGVRVPCAALSSVRSRATPSVAPSPPYQENPRWRSSTRERTELRCTEGRGLRSCSEVRVGGCAAVSDGSVCGYHPVGRTLTVYATTSNGARSVTLTATRDVVFESEDRRGPWLRVRSLEETGSALMVRGWVRSGAVRWAQEVPPSARVGLGIVGRAGHQVHLANRRGAVMLAPDTAVLDDLGASWGVIGRAFCAQAEQAPGDERVRFALPGATAPLPESSARVSAQSVRWVERCPDAAPGAVN